MSVHFSNKPCNIFGLFQKIRIFTLMVLLAVTTGYVVSPSVAQAQTYVFSSVQVDGNNRVDTGTVLSYAGIARGQSISAASLNDSYQKVLGSGLFRIVEFLPQGSRLVIRVEEFPTINVINIEGNKAIDDEAGLELITSRPRHVFSPSQVERDAAALADLYQLRGQFSATVTPKIIERSNNRVDIVFEVTEGRKSEIERLSFVGNRKFSDRRLRRVLETKQAGLLRAIIQRDTFIEDRIDFDKAVLNDFYQSRGYVDFQTLSVASEFSRERNAFFITFNVREGQSFKFGEITTSTDLEKVNADEFLAVSRVRSGQTYSPATVDNIIAKMERLAIQKGLNFVRVEPRVTRNDRDLSLDVDFALVRGPRIFVERIDIEGNATTLDHVVRRQFRVVEGDPFNPRQIRETAERIRALGLFSDVQVNARQGGSGDQVVVGVDVEEQPTGSLSFGASYSVSDGIGLTGAFSERNFLGRGQTLKFDVTVGADSLNSGFTFVEPAFLGRDLRFSLKIDYRETSFDYTDYDTKTVVIKPAFEFPVSENGRFGVNYTISDASIFNVSSGSSSLLMAEEADGSRLSSSIGYDYSYDTRRTGLNPNAGVVLRFGQDLGGFGGDVRFVKTTASLAGETKVFNEDVTLRATIEGGAVNVLSGASRLSDRFTLNASKLRGFAPAGIGPRDLSVTNQDALGGNYFAVARLETEFPIGLPEEYGVTAGIFADVGSVWGLDDNLGGVIDDDFHLRATIGISVFWRTAIGPLRFNFSRALVSETYDETQNFDLTISTRF